MGSSEAERRVGRDGPGGDASREPSRGTQGKAFESATEVEIAWAAGIFEGEGTIHARTSRGYVYPRIKIAMKDLDVLEKWQRIAGAGRIYTAKAPTDPKHAQMYELILQQGQQVRDAFYAVYPHLGQRRRARGMEILALTAKEKDAPNRRAAYR